MHDPEACFCQPLVRLVKKWLFHMRPGLIRWITRDIHRGHGTVRYWITQLTTIRPYAGARRRSGMCLRAEWGAVESQGGPDAGGVSQADA